MSRSDRNNWRDPVVNKLTSVKKEITKQKIIEPKIPRPIQEKVSLGIACCRLNGTKPEILLICKRFTYAFNTFAQGLYNSNSDEELIKLFNGMTVDEKHDILSLKFAQIWYRVWLNSGKRRHTYCVAKNKYDNAFLVDEGARLRRLISKSTNSDRIWEIPKGKKKNKQEPDIHCAIREFYEETGVPKTQYSILPRCKRTYSYIDAGVKYINNYFVAFTGHNVKTRVSFALQDQIDEICDIRWMDIETIRLVDRSGRLVNFVKPIFNYIKKHI